MDIVIVVCLRKIENDCSIRRRDYEVGVKPGSRPEMKWKVVFVAFEQGICTLFIKMEKINNG